MLDSLQILGAYAILIIGVLWIVEFAVMLFFAAPFGGLFIVQKLRNLFRH